jgi:homoserine O-acetyltransferase
MLKRRGLVLLAAVVLAISDGYSQSPSQATAAQAPSSHWTTQDGTVRLEGFRFGSGETLPELRLHYLTLGSPHRDAAGHVDNAILLLHGTGGNAQSLLNPILSDVLFVPGGVWGFP